MIKPQVPLSRTEERIYDMLVQGMSEQEIADEKICSVKAVKFHKKNIFLKCLVTSTPKLIVAHYESVIAEMNARPSKDTSPVTLTDIRQLVNVEAMALARGRSS